jgi:hypothetical protein
VEGTGALNHRDSQTGRKVRSGLALRPNWESRAGNSLNHSSGRFAGNSERTEPSEPKTNKFPQDFSREETLCEKGSEGSEGSELSLSSALKPGEGATLEQLQKIRQPAVSSSVRDDEDDEDVSGGINSRKSPISEEPAGHNAREVHINPRKSEPREGNSKTVSDVSDVSEEQLQEIQRLVREGMKEDIAREQVLGKGWVEP